MKGTITYDKGGNRHFFFQGQEIPEDEFYRLFPRAGILGRGCHVPAVPQVRQNAPTFSDALAVHPRQVAEAEADSRRKGVATSFLPDGRAVITSRAHQRAYLRAYGFRNHDGGWGD